MRSRQEEEKYRGDVVYDVWRSGANPDRINDDRVSDYFHNGLTSHEAAMAEIQRQQKDILYDSHDEFWPPEEFPDEIFPDVAADDWYD